MDRSRPDRSGLTTEQVRSRIPELGPWFHDMPLKGIWTAPGHFLGDCPNVKRHCYADALPHDLHGKTVLDIGRNGGFFSLEMKRRGADRVPGIDFGEGYLAQPRFTAEVEELDIEFRKMSVHDVGTLGERFDVVFSVDVFHHPHHPLLEPDLVHQQVARDLLVFQIPQRGSTRVAEVAGDYDFFDTAILEGPGSPRMHSIEHCCSHDRTNWWVPNRAGMESMLRSAGFEILDRPEEETCPCRHGARSHADYGPVYPARKGGQA